MKTLRSPTNYFSGNEDLAYGDKASEVYFDNSRYINIFEKRGDSEAMVRSEDMMENRLNRKFAGSVQLPLND